MTTREKVLSALRKHKSFLVSTHVNPDPDALGSELSMAIFLRAMGKNVHIVNEEPAPRRLAFLPQARRIKGCAKSRNIVCDAAIILDCGELDRIGKAQKLISTEMFVINIDHHVTNDFFGDLNLVEPKASSTAEVLYLLFKEAGHALTKDLAFNLYVGLMTDTGSFRFENTTARTHAICADLMRFGFSVTDIYRKVYASIPYKDLKEFTKLISRFDVLYGGTLVGDSTDNIPGIPGVGPKTAVKWLEEYGSLENLVKNANAITGKIGERFFRGRPQTGERLQH